MALRVINTGVVGNDGTGDAIRTAFSLVNQNFAELYALFGAGGQFNFTDLDDGPTELGQNKIPMSNSEGSYLLMKSLIAGTAIQITNTLDSITISSNASKVEYDDAPTLSTNLNANNKSIVNVKDIDSLSNDDVTSIINTYELSGTIDEVKGQFATNKNYVDDEIINATCSTINLYVSTTGSDTDTSLQKGRNRKHAFRTIFAAAQYAAAKINSATPVLSALASTLTSTHNTVKSNSTITTVTMVGQQAEITVNYGPIDQGVSPHNQILPGRYLRGKTSNTLATVVRYNSSTDNTKLYATVISGGFVNDEELEIGYPEVNLYVNLYVENGVYEELFPIQIPENVSIIGESSTGVIVKPIDDTNTSTFGFYRNATFDGLTITSTPGYNTHYNNIHNSEIDAFLLNNGSVLENITLENSSAFLAVLDPTGVINAKYPKIINCKTTTNNDDVKLFAGGLFIDGFSGKIPFSIIDKDVTNTELEISNIDSVPHIPTIFFVDGTLYRVYNIQVDTQLQTGTVTLDPVTPFTPTITVAIDSFFEMGGDRKVIVENCIFQNNYGYGIIAENTASVVVKNTTTEYCYHGFYSSNGSRIQSQESCNRYGINGLISSGWNTNLPVITGKLVDDAAQIVRIDTAVSSGALYIDVYNFSLYLPYPGCEIEVKHNGESTSTYYTIANVAMVDTSTSNTKVARLYLNSTGHDNIVTGTINQNSYAIVRSKYNVKLSDLSNTFSVRPLVSSKLNSNDENYAITTTAGKYFEFARTTANPLTYNTLEDLAETSKIVTFDNPLDYISIVVVSASNNTVVINELSAYDRARIINYHFTFITTSGGAGFESKILSYTVVGSSHQLELETSTSGTSIPAGAVIFCGPYKHTDISNPQVFNIHQTSSVIVASNHIFDNVGTGSIITTKTPNDILGVTAYDNVDVYDQVYASNVYETNCGRIFYSSIDQNGIYKIGEVIEVDQLSKNISFLHDLSIRNVAGFGFKTGAVVTSFSTDDSFTNNSSKSVPTESAVRGYIDRRLGLSHNEAIVSNVISPGFVDRTGKLNMLGTFDLNNHKAINMTTPENPLDGSNKAYVDLMANLNKLGDVSLSNLNDGDILVYKYPLWKNAVVGEDITVTMSDDGHNAYFSLKSNVITNANVALDAGIDQSKLSLRNASVGVDLSNRGICSFSSDFTVVNGHVSLATSTAYEPYSVLGNNTSSLNPPTYMSFNDIVNYGDGITHGFFVLPNQNGTTGLMTVTQTGQGVVNTYSVTGMSDTPLASYVVTRKVDGGIDCNALYINSTKIINNNNSTLELFTLGSSKFLSASGSGNLPTVNLTGTFSLTTGSTFQATYADIAEYYHSDKYYDIGTVMIFSGLNEVTQSNILNDTRIAGVITENPSYVLNTDCPDIKACIALVGKVKVKVIGKVKKGDMLVSSNMPGYAITSKTPATGTVIGKALEDKNDNDIGMIYLSVIRG